MVYFLIVAFAIFLDQIAKYIIVYFMEPGQSIPVLEGIFHITYIHNSGAAFSFFQGQRALLIVFPAFLILVGAVYLYKHRKDKRRTLMVSVAFIVGGGIGNLIDRVTQGYVVDFLDFRVFPIFNMADIFVTVGCGLLCVYILFIDGKKGRQ